MSAVAVAVVLVGAVLLISAPPAAACSCGISSDAQAFESSDVVFTGELLEIRTPPGVPYSSADPERFIFEVDAVYKGDARSTQSVVTPREGASCGLELAGRGPFLVFADTQGSVGLETEVGELSSHLCSGTRELETAPLPASFHARAAPEGGASPPASPGDDGGAPVVAGGALLALAGGLAVWWVTRLRRAG